MNDFSLI